MMADGAATGGKAPAAAKRNSRAELHVSGPDEDPRPIVRLRVELHLVIEEATRALEADPDLYERDGELVHVVWAPLPKAAKDSMVPPDVPTIRKIHKAVLRARLTRYARWVKWSEKEHEWVGAIPTDHIVDAIINMGTWAGLRSIVGVVEGPSLRPDGTVITEPGYDAATGFLYFPNADY